MGNWRLVDLLPSGVASFLVQISDFSFFTAGKYVLFDCPGQVELFTHHHAIRNIAEKLSNWGWQVRAQGSGCRVQGAGCGVRGAGCRVQHRRETLQLGLAGAVRNLYGFCRP